MVDPHSSTSTTDSSAMMEELSQACSSGDISNLQTLLADPKYVQIALAHEMRPYNAVRVSIPNLSLLLQSGARAGQSASIKDLIHFASEHGVPLHTLITSDTLLAALDGGSLDVLTLFVTARPETANLDLGHVGDPLAQALHKQQFDHVSYLLDHGANPNSRCAGHKGPGYHLRVAAQKLPLEYTKLLLQHAAQVPQSGAVHMAAEKGRVDVLQALVEGAGGDDVVDERLEPSVGFLSHKHKQQQASETPLMVATRCGQREAVRWLLERGASVQIQDLQGKTAGTIAAEGKDEDIIALFEKSD